MAKTFMKKPEEAKDLISLIGWVTQGRTIQAGLARENALFSYIKEKYKSQKHIKVESKIKIESPEITFKKGKHEVDIIITDNIKKSITMINSKSDGESGTDSPTDRVKVPVAAKSAVQKNNPGYTVEYIYVRPSGKANPVFEKFGIPTVATSLLIDGKDINALISEEMKKITLDRVETAIKRFCWCESNAKDLREIFSNPNLYKIKD